LSDLDYVNKVIHMKLTQRTAALMLLLVFSFLACKEEDDPKPSVNNPNGDINAWIYDIMDEVYYWTSQLPAADATDDSQDPIDYFSSLMVQEDRFSVIYEDYQELINSLNAVALEAGYSFQLFQEPGSGEIIAQIKYVKKGFPASSAELAGLRRGDVIRTINGTTMTVDNYRDVISQISETHTITYERYSENSGQFEEMGEITLQTAEFAENPIRFDTVYSLGDSKIGYFMYTRFIPGLGQTREYDQEMDAVFGDFKSQGITDLIVDLRYNRGGSISSATNLASLIAPNVTSTDILYENRWNDLYQNYIEGLENGDDILRGKFTDKSENVGAGLNGMKAYFLVSRETASASELVINGLLPYMDVELIGITTIGKNVGSIPIEDDEDPENSYGLLPIVLKTFNSDGNSDYDQGFTPVGDRFIDEYDFLWYPEGDARDPLISKAIEIITGEPLPSSIAGRKAVIDMGMPIFDPSEIGDETSLPLIMDTIELPRK
jgi:C-terminal processing protease CtpA/Prc